MVCGYSSHGDLLPLSALAQSDTHHAYIEGDPVQVQKAIAMMDEIVKVVPSPCPVDISH